MPRVCEDEDEDTNEGLWIGGLDDAEGVWSDGYGEGEDAKVINRSMSGASRARVRGMMCGITLQKGDK